MNEERLKEILRGDDHSYNPLEGSILAKELLAAQKRVAEATRLLEELCEDNVPNKVYGEVAKFLKEVYRMGQQK